MNEEHLSQNDIAICRIHIEILTKANTFIGKASGIEEHKEKLVGFQKSKIATLKSKIKKFLTDLGENTLSPDDLFDFHDTCAAIEKFAHIVYEITGRKSVHLDYPAQSHIHLKPSQPISNQQFYLYSFYLKPKAKEPKLSRATIVFKKNGSVEVKNAKDGNSEELTGWCRPTNHQTINIDLYSKNSQKAVHLKFYCNNATWKDEVYRGSYISYEHEIIIRGACLIQKHEGDAHPEILSIYDSPDEYGKIHKEIIDYLALRGFNQTKVAKLTNSLTSLGRHTSSYYIDSPYRRFLEYPIPKIYISFSNSTINKTDFKEMVELARDLKETIGQEVEQEFEVNYVKEKYGNDHKESRPPSLKALRTTRYFIILHHPTPQISFNIVQLGYALGTAKHIFLCYKEGSLSKNLLRVRLLNVTLIPYSSLPDDWDKIKETITEKINDDFILKSLS